MDFEKLTGKVVVFIPIIHILTCGIFIAGYSSGFGSYISGLFSASDFVTITLQHLLQTYITTLFIPVVVVALRHRMGFSYVSDRVTETVDPQERESLIRYQKFMARLLSSLLPFLALLGLIVLLLQVHYDLRRSYQFLVNLFMLALIPVWWKVANSLRVGGILVEFAWLALCFICGTFALGMETGQNDRYLAYSELRVDHMICNQSIILTPIGDKFLGATPDGQRSLISTDCKSVFKFRPLRRDMNGSISDHIRAS